MIQSLVSLIFSYHRYILLLTALYVKSAFFSFKIIDIKHVVIQSPPSTQHTKQSFGPVNISKVVAPIEQSRMRNHGNTNLLFRPREYLKNPLILVFLGSSYLLNILNWALLYFYIKPSYGQIPLHYNAMYGADVFGSWDMVFRIPSAGLIILVIHNILSKLFYSKERLASHVLLSSAFIVQLFLLLASLSIIYINSQYEPIM